jgi:putative toxin-antitoxin system antitoxin component (TIGR02293 family)
MAQTARVDPKKGSDLSRFWEEIESGGWGSGHPYLLLLGLDPVDTPRLVERVEEGFSFGELERLRQNVGLSREEISELVQIRPRTLDRRKKEGQLHPDESDRLLRASRVFGRAIALFEGDVEGALRWLSSSQRALGGAVPLEMARTEIGAREVEGLIGRLEHGVFS